jgi:LysM domain
LGVGSLTAHLLEPGDHGRLPFHPSCPVCRRERLSGTLTTEPVISRRTQAVFASGVLAVSTGIPGVAIGAVPDRQAEGVAAPEDLPGGELDDPEFDPGGETSLPFETAPVPGEAEHDDGTGAPIDAEPVDDPDGRLAPLVAEDEAQTEGATPVTEVVPTPTDGEGVAGTQAPPATLAPTEEVTPPDPTSDDPPPDDKHRRPAGRPEQDHRLPGRSPAGENDPNRADRPGVDRAGAETPAAQPPQAPSAQPPAPPSDDPNLTVPATDPALKAQTATAPPAVPQPAATPDASVTDASATGRERGYSLRGNRRYLVEPGDSLWTIAKRLVGPGASPAQIAREVDRLWSLNEARIATGDPDLLLVGTQLRLR